MRITSRRQRIEGLADVHRGHTIRDGDVNGRVEITKGSRQVSDHRIPAFDTIRTENRTGEQRFERRGDFSH
ncbi:MAG: hypothetical protein DI569_15420 [Sphingopyxis macrogoltabida]|uniref:Uncharacterized protein n=1 Tax=Sphingopyxis macrogoltabida TaxID=33050 RepID=A0A2W5L0P3_SPHMC|nr:MAG: hypothetical protein DI569_15420 [Sphingopyxis macrogoltabida]